MIKKKILKVVLTSATLASLVASTVAASCNHNETEQNDKKVVLAAAQGDTWPLMKVLSPLIEEYNKTHEKDKDFIPVELWTKTKTKTIAQLQLAQNTADAIKQKNAVIPNILLADQAGAFIINAQNSLLNVKKYGFNAEFNSKIEKLHNTLPGQTKEMLYSIPFDIEDDSSLVFNLDLMAKIFDIIKTAGGNVDENMELFIKAKNAQQTGSSIPTNSIFQYLKAKPQNSLSDMNVTADTFKTFAGIRNFVTTFYKNVEVDASEFPAANANDPATVLNGSLLSIDYSADVFLKDAQSTDYVNQFWTVKETGDNNEPTKVSFEEFKNQNSDVAQKFIKLWNEWTGNLGNPFVTQQNTNNITFQSIVFDNLGKGDWAPYKIGAYKTAIAFMPSIGINGTQLNPDNLEKASNSDVLMMPQITLANEGKTNVYAEGGSSFVPVKSEDDNLNKATIKFLNWIYSGATHQNDQDMPVWEYLAENSGYVMPLKNVVTEENLNKLIEKRDQLLKGWNDFYNNISPTDKQNKDLLTTKYITLLKKANFLTAAITALKSMLNYTNDDYKPMNQPNDALSKKFSSRISSDLVQSSTIAQKTENGQNVDTYELTNSGESEWEAIKTNVLN